jgi:hypothetical protein
MGREIVVNKIEIRNLKLYLDDSDFASEIINGCVVQKSNLVQNREMNWLTFDPLNMDTYIERSVREILNHIFDLRRQQRDEYAIEVSDTFFQSFTPLMNILIEQNNFYQVSNMWIWIISKVKSIEESRGIEFGKGVHKGSAYFFLAFSQMMMRDIEGAYMSFAEAAKEDEIFPKSVLERHEKRLPPSVKVLLLDLGKQNFAYGLVKQIREAINDWESTHPDISQKKSVVESLRNAIEKGKIHPEIAINFNYALTKAFIVDLWMKSHVRPTSLTITQTGETILRFARILEDFIRASQNLNKNDSVFKYSNNTWFTSEDWRKISSYENDVKALIDDFINDKWKLSKDGRNMVLTFKIRNALAHRIPNDSKLFENYIEIVLAISSSFGFICDKISR